jgi:hypothetical protein
MNTTHTRTKFLTAAVGAVIAGAAAPALLVLGAGTAQATPDISARGPGIIGDLPTPRSCGGCDGFNPQPDPHDYPDVRPPLTGDPGGTVGIIIEGSAPSPSLNPGDTAGFVIYG